MRGRKPDERRYRQVVAWFHAGKTPAWIAEQLGLKRADALIARARAWEKRQRGSADDKVTDRTLRLIDQVITDGLKVQAAVVKDALAATRRECAALAKQVQALSAKVGELEARPAQVVELAAGPAAPASAVAPSSLWLWVVGECVRQLGMSGLVAELEVSQSLVDMWLRGATPNARQREELKRVLATIWARDLFDDRDDLLDARDRLPMSQNAEAL